MNATDRHGADWSQSRHMKAQALEDKRRNLREAVTVLYDRLLLADCIGEDAVIPEEKIAELMKGIKPYVPGDELLKIHGDGDGPLTDDELRLYRLRAHALNGEVPDGATHCPTCDARVRTDEVAEENRRAQR